MATRRSNRTPLSIRNITPEALEAYAKPIRVLEIDEGEYADGEYASYLARLDKAEADRQAALEDLAALARRRAPQAARKTEPTRILEIDTTDSEYEAYLAAQAAKEAEAEAAREATRAPARARAQASVTVIIVGRFDGIEY